MEYLLQLTWYYRLFPLAPLVTTEGKTVEVLHVGKPNRHAGPDFEGAHLRIGKEEWIGAVEIHLRSSDWRQHRHQHNPTYNNVVLHVVTEADSPVYTANRRCVPQVVIPISTFVLERYEQLVHTENYPPCHEALAYLCANQLESWLDQLLTERLEARAERIRTWLTYAEGDWERVAFIALARNYGFGVNGDAFEAWAKQVPCSAIGKHRDQLFQIEAMFLGLAGMLDLSQLPQKMRATAQSNEYFLRLQAEYAYLARKFSFTPMGDIPWRFHRLRPANNPILRLAQFAAWYHRHDAGFTRLIEADTLEQLYDALSTTASGYWAQHYGFGVASALTDKSLPSTTLDLLIINTVTPLLYTYGQERNQPILCDKAKRLLRAIKAERNHITRAWEVAGLRPANAAESQALIQLHSRHCDRRECLRCRVGKQYLNGKFPKHALSSP
ncbi:MAG: DUF2851 family protein [Bacteroidales bacterium]|nr:DUF2851 family protein [Bacteroidales bacterium]